MLAKSISRIPFDNKDFIIYTDVSDTHIAAILWVRNKVVDNEAITTNEKQQVEQQILVIDSHYKKDVKNRVNDAIINHIREVRSYSSVNKIERSESLVRTDTVG